MAKNIGTLLIGAALGAAATLLWKDKAANLGVKVPTGAGAPSADLIGTIKEKGAEWIGEAGEHFVDLKNSATQKIGEVKQEANGKARVVSAEVSDATASDEPA